MNICIMEGKCVILRSISREKTEKIQKVYKKREVTEMKIKKIMAGMLAMVTVMGSLVSPLSVKADQIGMLATVMNCIYVSDIFRYAGMKTEVFTPFVCGAFTTLFSKDAAVEALNEGKVVFFAGGTGHPYFSTDTGAVLRAIEIEADAMLLAKAIDGIYDSDPKVNPEAKKYDEISIQEIIDKKLMAVDLTASIMCLENKMPMLVFGLNEENSIVETMKGTFTGTKVTV